MARVWGLQLVYLMVLGCTVGIFTFVYWNSRRELSDTRVEGRNIRKKMLDSDNEAKTLQYKNSLMESDIETFQKEKNEDKVAISVLRQQVEDLQTQMASSKEESEKIKKENSQIVSEKYEWLGIEEAISTDLEECRKKQSKCEQGKNLAIRAASSNALKRVKLLEEANKKLSSDVMKEKEELEQLKQNIVTCESKLVTSPQNVVQTQNETEDHDQPQPP